MLDLKTSIRTWVDTAFKDTPLFLVDIQIIKRHRLSITVTIDGYQRLGIQDCVRLTKLLKRQLNESDMLPDYDLTVTSAGIGKPLKIFKQYEKNVNRLLRIVCRDGQVIKGKLIAFKH